MKLPSHRRLLTVVALAVVPLFAFAQKPLVIKFSYTIASDTPKGKATQKFKELVEERTKGAVKVEIYPNASLFKDKEEIEALQVGAVQMLAPAVSKFGPMGLREFEAFDLPYLFDNEAELKKVLEGPIGTGLLQKLSAKGAIGLAYWTSGFRGLSANKPLRTPADAKGLKFRIPSSKVLDSEIRAIGGIPQVMASSEVYQGLDTKVVDGTEATPSNLYTQKLYEVQQHFTLTNHSALIYAVIVNRTFWESLSAPTRGTLETAMKEATKYGNDLAAKDNEDAVAGIKKSGKTQVYALSTQEHLAWKKAWMKVHTEHASKIGQELIQSIYKATDFDANK